jgi:acyl-CoA synthetase (AMP-forming)/AMP-acid ligase II
VPIPDDISLADFVIRGTSDFGDRVALVDHVSGRSLTYQQVAAQARNIAGALQARGLRKGEVFMVLSPNVPEFPVAFLGITMAGGIVTTANPNYTTPELQHQASDSGAQYLLTTPELLYHVAELKHTFKEVFVMGEGEGATPFADLLLTSNEPTAISIHPKTDLVALPYSSGTTSLPKGVCLTHYNIIANLCQYDNPAFNRLTAEDSILGLLPFFHIYGLTIVLFASLMKGGRVVTLQKFEPMVFLDALQQRQISMAYVAPPIVHFLAKHPVVDQYDLSHLRDVFSGAAPLGMGLAQTCAERLHTQMRQGYGMTEMSPVSHVLSFDARHKHNSIGRLVSNMTLKIVDPETKAAVPRGETGELWLKGPNIMPRYLNKPEATAETIDEEGYLHTGDVGYMDEDGDCYIVDRMKELIKVKGFQVAPAEIEDILQKHPAVVDCGVIGIPFEGDEAPKAFLVLQPGVEGTPALNEDIIHFAAERTARYKKIRAISYVDAIPKLPSGKIVRRRLRELHAAEAV